MQELTAMNERYYRSGKRIRKYKPDLSYIERSSMLEIPKPTVDSGLLRLQKLFAKSFTPPGINQEDCRQTVNNT